MPSQETSIISKIWHPNSNAARNFTYLLQSYESNNAMYRESLAVLERIQNLKSNPEVRLTKPPKVKTVFRTARLKKGEKIGRAEGTGHRLGFVRKIDFEFPERKEQHTEKDYHELSIRNEALWHSLMSDLNLPPAKFKKHYVFEKKKQAQLQKDKEILSEKLYLQGLTALPKNLQKKLSTLGIDTLIEAMRYLPELRICDTEGIRFKRDAHHRVKRLARFIERENIPAPRAYASAIKILSPEMAASPADWARVYACAAQLLKDPLKGVLGPLAEDFIITTQEKHPLKQYLNLDETSKTLWWYALPKKYRKKTTLRSLLGKLQSSNTKLYLSIGLAEAIKRTNKVFLEERSKFISQEINKYFHNNLEQLAETFWPIYERDMAEFHASKQEDRLSQTALNKKAYHALQKLFGITLYRQYEGAVQKRKRPDNLEESLIRLCSINEASNLAKDISVETRRHILSKEHKQAETEKYLPVEEVDTETKLKDRLGNIIPVKKAIDRILQARIDSYRKLEKSPTTYDLKTFESFRKLEGRVVEAEINAGLVKSELLKQPRLKARQERFKDIKKIELLYNTTLNETFDIRAPFYETEKKLKEVVNYLQILADIDKTAFKLESQTPQTNIKQLLNEKYLTSKELTLLFQIHYDLTNEKGPLHNIAYENLKQYLEKNKDSCWQEFKKQTYIFGPKCILNLPRR